MLDSEKGPDMLSRSLRGFSLIEVMITIVVMSILAMLAMPSFTTWLANSRVRSTAESLQNGLRLAQAEAVRRSRQTVFVLTSAAPALSATPSTTGKNWYIQALPLSGSSSASSASSSSSAAAGSSAASTDFIRGDAFATQNAVNVTGDNAIICFNSVGRLVSNSATGISSASCSAPDISVNYRVTATGADRPLTVQVSLGGKIRMCDPAKTLSDSHPDGCTAASSSSSSASSS